MCVPWPRFGVFLLFLFNDVRSFNSLIHNNNNNNHLEAVEVWSVVQKEILLKNKYELCLFDDDGIRWLSVQLHSKPICNCNSDACVRAEAISWVHCTHQLLQWLTCNGWPTYGDHNIVANYSCVTIVLQIVLLNNGGSFSSRRVRVFNQSASIKIPCDNSGCAHARAVTNGEATKNQLLTCVVWVCSRVDLLDMAFVLCVLLFFDLISSHYAICRMYKNLIPFNIFVLDPTLERMAWRWSSGHVSPHE